MRELARMASWQVRTLAWFIRAVIRRADWGPPALLARRARRAFGPPAVWQWFVSLGFRVQRVDTPVKGEWVSDGTVASTRVILYFHGGGYVSCSARTHRPITTALARQTAARVFAVDYRLAPEHPFPAAIDDAFAAYEWMLSSGISARHIALGGDSAGGGLVLALCVRLRDAGVELPRCCVCFSPWTDLAGEGESLRTNASADTMFAPGNVQQFAHAVLAGASPRTPLASPVFADLAGLPPFLIEVGREEQLLDDARRVDDRLRAAGGSCTLDVVDGVFHGWQLCARLMPEADRSLARASQFISQHLVLE